MENKKNKIIIILSIVILFVLITFFNSITTVPTGFVGVKTRFGKVQDTVIQEGLNFKVPYIEKIVRIDCRTKKNESKAEGSTKDMQIVSISLAVNYNVNKETANNLYKNVGVDFEPIIINPAIAESVKSTMAKYTAEELIIQRADVSNEIEKTLDEKICDKGFQITEFNLINIDFSEEYDRAIEQKAVKQQEVVTAQAELQKAQIDNQKRVENAKADAEVMRNQNQEITEKTLELKKIETQQKAIEKWNGQLPSTSLGDNIPMIGLNK